MAKTETACTSITGTSHDSLFRRRWLMLALVCLLVWLSVSLSVAVSASDDFSQHLSAVQLTGSSAFSGATPIRFGSVRESYSLLSYLAVGEHDPTLSPLFAFTLQAPWRPQPRPETIAFLEEEGKSPEDISLFLFLDYETQLLQMMSQEVVLEAMLAGRMPDLEEAEASLPPEVAADLRRLQVVRDEQYLSYEAELVVLAQDPQGRVRRSVGEGVVQYREADRSDSNESAAERRQLEALFDGKFWGTFRGAAGEGELHGDFAAVPFELDAPWVEASVQSRWERDQTEGTSLFEKHWDRLYPISGFRIGVPQAMDELDHDLTIELLLADNHWNSVYQASLGPGFSTDDENSIVEFGVMELLLNRRHIDITLPDTVTAGAVRFRLHGAPFTGEHWDLEVRTGQMQAGEAVWQREWRYFHGW